MELVIGIDAGHGGEDKGACHNGIVEADYNMAIARALASKIALWDSSYDPLTLQLHSGETLSLKERGARSKKLNCDFVLSLHVNAAANPEQRGLLCFHWPGNSITASVGSVIMRSAPSGLHKPGWRSIAADDTDETWLQRPKNVLQVHAAPCILVEMAYCTNVQDAALLKDETIIEGLIAAMIAGLVDFKRLSR